MNASSADPCHPEPSVRHWTIGLALLALAVYAHTLGHGFAFDDGIEVVRNTSIRSLSHWPAIFRQTAWAGAGWEQQLYRPLTLVSYSLNYLLTGLSPWSYHLVNILLHGLISVLLFRLALRWGLAPTAAGLGAALFAVHPVHVEVVANVAGRKELLVAVFILATLIAHHRARREDGFWLGWAPLALAAALFSKENGLVTLGLLVLQDMLTGVGTPLEPERRRLARLYALYASVALVYLVIRVTVVGGWGLTNIPFIDNPAAGAPWPLRLITSVVVIGRGLCLLVAPVTLSPDYSYRAIPLVTSPLDPAFLLTMVVVAAAAVRMVLGYRSHPLWVFAAAWCGISLAPTANLLFPIGTVFGERLLYLPSMGFCLLVALYLMQAGRALLRTPARAILIILLGMLALRTVTYASAWKDDLTLFAVAARVVPDSTKVHYKLGDALVEAGRLAEAVDAYERALAITSDNYKAALNLGAVLVHLQRLDEAEATYRRVLETRPRDADALNGLGIIRRQQGRMPEAVEFWSQAIAADPRHARSLGDLGTAHLLAGELDQARSLFERAAQADSDLATAWYNLGILYHQMGEVALARHAWHRFLATAGPEYAEQRTQVDQLLHSPP